MTTIRWETVVIDTFAWIFGVRAFLDEIETAIPEAASKASENLERLAKEQNWDEANYSLEVGELDTKFKRWLPRLLGYSAVTMIYTVVETQLTATANRLREQKNYSLKVNEVRGDPVERAKRYFTKVAGIQVGSDKGWEVLQDLAEVRNIIVHRRGRQGLEPKDRHMVQQLTKRYPGEISLSGRHDDSDAELEVSLAVCKRFIDETERFFERMFVATGWPLNVAIEH